MVKFPEAQARLFKGKFVCKSCKATIKAPNIMVLQGRVKCKNCGLKKLRPKRKK